MESEVIKKFNNELSSIHESKAPSKAKIQEITRAALKAKSLYKHVVFSVEKFLIKCKPEHRLHVLYIIDSIIRASKHQFKEKDVFAARFIKSFDKILKPLLALKHPEQMKVIRTLNLWQANGVYTKEEIAPFREICEKNGLDTDFEAVERAVKGGSADMRIYGGSYIKKVKTTSARSTTPTIPPPNGGGDGLLGANPSHFVPSEEYLEGTISQREMLDLIRQTGFDQFGRFQKDHSLLIRAHVIFVNNLLARIQRLKAEQAAAAAIRAKSLANVLSQGFNYSDDEDENGEENQENKDPPPLTREMIFDMARELINNETVKEGLKLLLSEANKPPAQPEIPPQIANLAAAFPPQLNPQLLQAIQAQNQQLAARFAAQQPPPVAPPGAGVQNVPPPGLPPNIAGLVGGQQLQQQLQALQAFAGAAQGQVGQVPNQQQVNFQAAQQAQRALLNQLISQNQSTLLPLGLPPPGVPPPSSSASQQQQLAPPQGPPPPLGVPPQFQHHDPNGIMAQQLAAQQQMKMLENEMEFVAGVENEHERSRHDSRSSGRSRERERSKERERRKFGLPQIKEGITYIASRTLWFKKVPPNCSELDLKKAVESCGEANRVKIISNRACAYVTMENRKSANDVINRLKEVEVAKKMVKVYWARSPGMNEEPFFNMWDIDKGVISVPYDKLPPQLEKLCEGAILDLESLPEKKRQMYKENGEIQLNAQIQPQTSQNSAIAHHNNIQLPPPQPIQTSAGLPPQFYSGVPPPGLPSGYPPMLQTGRPFGLPPPPQQQQPQSFPPAPRPYGAPPPMYPPLPAAQIPHLPPANTAPVTPYRAPPPPANGFAAGGGLPPQHPHSNMYQRGPPPRIGEMRRNVDNNYHRGGGGTENNERFSRDRESDRRRYDDRDRERDRDRDSTRRRSRWARDDDDRRDDRERDRDRRRSPERRSRDLRRSPSYDGGQEKEKEKQEEQRKTGGKEQQNEQETTQITVAVPENPIRMT